MASLRINEQGVLLEQSWAWVAEGLVPRLTYASGEHEDFQMFI